MSPTAQAPSPLRVAVVGAGFIASRGHLPALQHRTDTEVVALVDVNAERSLAVAEQFRIPATFTDYATMLREAQPDLVIIGTPNVLHAPQTLAAIEAGAHVLVEKPMATSAVDAQRMADAARAAGRVLTIGLHNRYRPEMNYLKGLVDAGELGRIYYAKISLLRRRGIPGFGSWFTNKDLAGGGAIMDIGVHMVDLALWLMGSPTPVSVMGVTYAEFGPRARALGGWGVDAPPAGASTADGRFDVDDLAAGMVRFDNGATLMVDISWAGYSPSEEHLHLLGTEGGAEIHGADRQAPTQTPLKLYHDYMGRPTETLPVFPPLPASEGSMVQQLDTLISAIRHGTPLRVTPEQVVVVTAILESLQESARLGRSVDIELPRPAL